MAELEKEKEGDEAEEEGEVRLYFLTIVQMCPWCVFRSDSVVLTLTLILLNIEELSGSK